MIVDLSIKIGPSTPVFPGDMPYSEKIIGTIEKDGYNQKNFCLSTHIGTHIDSPYHMIEQGKRLDQYNIEDLIGNAEVFDVKDLKQIDKENIDGDINTPFIILNTNHSTKIYEDDYYSKNPVMTERLAKYIIDSGVKLVAIDSFTVDDFPFKVHKMFFENEILIVENIVNVYKLPKKLRLFVVPINLTYADGAPARVFAEF